MDGEIKRIGPADRVIADTTMIVTIHGQHGVPLHRKVVAGQAIPPELVEAYEAETKPKATTKPKVAAD